MRCKACDSEFTQFEVLWRKEQKQFEDLCRTCRRIVHEALSDMSTSNKSYNNRIPDDVRIIYYEDAIDSSNDEGEINHE